VIKGQLHASLCSESVRSSGDHSDLFVKGRISRGCGIVGALHDTQPHLERVGLGLSLDEVATGLGANPAEFGMGFHGVVALDSFAFGGAEIARFGAGFSGGGPHRPIAGAHASAAHLKAPDAQFQAFRIVLVTVGKMLGAVPHVLGA